MKPKLVLWTVLATLVQLQDLPQAAQAGGSDTHALANLAFELRVKAAEQAIDVGLEATSLGLRLAQGPCLYRAVRAEGSGGQADTYARLEKPSVAVRGDRLTIRGRLAGLQIEHRFVLPGGQPIMEEQVWVRNDSDRLLSLSDFEVALQRPVADADGHVLPELAQDRFVAVPLRARATDPKGLVNDFSIEELISQPGYEPRVAGDQRYSQVPVPRRQSEGWAWTHGTGTLGLFVFNQQHMLFSVVSWEKQASDTVLRFGGARMIGGEPAALTRIAPGQTVDLGVVRYHALPGGYMEAMYAFRAWLDANGCRFPPDYNPPIHWEQLYDMEGAWDDRLHRYTKATLETEASKGVEYSCEALYLDPGWDTLFGSFVWGDQWLGPRRDFVAEMKSRFGLTVSLHCPLATWVSFSSMGPTSVQTWPSAARRVPPSPRADRDPNQPLKVPAVRDGRRNLALLPGAKATASSVYQGGAMPIHQTAHLNDGWYGNSASWIADRLPAWAEIDLGAEFTVGQVRLGNDHAMQFVDRAASDLRLLAATDYNPDSNAATWRTVGRSRGEPLQAEKVFSFAPTRARWVRVEILNTGQDMPRLDEIEIYDAAPVSSEEAQSFAQAARRGPEPQPPGTTGPSLCLGSKQYLDEAEKRLLDQCADGVVFLMYDGNWWNGGCLSPDHGHPVPYRIEDHIRANLDLAQRIHAKYPKVLIEMHDPIAGGSPARVTPVYYKYGLPGSYDENWGFELMWDSMADLKAGRGRSLYYYNLGCNVPIYLHINLRGDNEHCVVLWWYASTCRHLGIGGTSSQPRVVAAQKEAMKTYRRLDRFFKRGDFYGINEEIHLHALPKETAFVVNLFNLSDQRRTVGGSIPVERMGLNPGRSYKGAGGAGGTVEQGEFKVSKEMPPWSAEIAEFRAE